MPLEFAVSEFLKAFLAIFIAMDAIGNLPILYLLTKKLSVKERNKNVDKAIFIATILLLVFLLFGIGILGYFGISFNSFRVAGGIVLLIMGLRIVLGLRLMEEGAKKYELSAVPLATPLIVGPAVITVTILLVNESGFLITLIAAAANLIASWIILHQTELLFKILGRQGSEVIARIMGLILTALAVEFIKIGWVGL
ncbi:MarC family protein [Candidatus Woesearchaeota archaeon]|nr:MarC family protein [Candidatus Woesearchaeota archaeon]